MAGNRTRTRGGRAQGESGGQGTVYRRASDGRWVAAVRLPGGRRLWRYGASEREARARLSELLRRQGAGLLAAPSRMTVGEWVERWLERKASTVRPKTVRIYTQVLGCLTAEVGAVRLDRCGPLLLAEAFRRMAARGVGSRVREQAYVYGKSCFAEAVRVGALAQNPFDRIAKPKHEGRQRPEWSPAEAARFLAACERSRLRYAGMCALALLTGLRRGEAAGLEWRDVDFTGRRLAVRRQRLVVGGTPGWGPLKTKAARRLVPLSERAVGLLRRQWESLPEERRRPEAPVFCTDRGTPPHPDNLKRTLWALCREAGVPVVSLHQLRHTFASLAAAGGLDPVTLARVLGHSRPSTSLDIYAYPLGGERAAGAVERALTVAVGADGGQAPEHEQG
jgi:integrase